MAGQIIKRGARTWLVRLFLGRDGNGKQKFHYKTVHGTKKDAERYLNQRVLERDTGPLVQPSRMTLDEYLDEWLEIKRPSLHERTYADYDELLKRYIRPKLGAVRLQHLDLAAATSRRRVDLSPFLVAKLKQHKRHQAENRLQLGAKYQNLDLVFATANGGPINQNNLNARNFKDICKRAELNSKTTLYTLRHTCATMLLLFGENPKVISERLGHSSVAVTLDIYSHVLPTMQQDATANLARRLYAVAQ